MFPVLLLCSYDMHTCWGELIRKKYIFLEGWRSIESRSVMKLNTLVTGVVKIKTADFLRCNAVVWKITLKYSDWIRLWRGRGCIIKRFSAFPCCFHSILSPLSKLERCKPHLVFLFATFQRRVLCTVQSVIYSNVPTPSLALQLLQGSLSHGK